MNLWTGVVENRNDPLKLGRCQVRVVGLHTHDKTVLPTEELPWAFPMQPITSAAMNGIGTAPVGVVEGTWVIVMFRDDDHQQPIILGTIGGIPQKESRTVDSDDENISFDGPTTKIEETPKGTVLITSDGGTVNDGNGNPIKTGDETVTAKVVTPKSLPSSIPPASAKRGIDALNKAMDEAGFTGKYGRAAVLGIAGGESAWVPQSEGYFFKKPESLQAIFVKTFKNNRAAAEKYANWTGTREAFFHFVYAPENNGSLVGNSRPDDGGKFYGRGFIQLTGRPNYEKYARLSGIDIVNNPQLLNDDYEASAKVAVAYFKDRVKVSPDDPSYLRQALPRVGADANGTGYPKKEGYYNYFLGEAAPPPEQTDKSTNPGSESQSVPISASGFPADREQNLVLGFTDPNMKYPLRDYIGEPDTNRLARGKIIGTPVELKDKKILKDVPLPNGKSWSQPDVPYGARYPFNKVMETESGHVMEFDDTPEYERVHIYHRKGTYTEIDPNGTQVNRIVGDGYSIVERNGYVVIAGKCNITVYGEANLLVQNDANIQVEGDTNLQMKGNANFGVAGDFNITVGGAFKVKAGSMFLDSTGDINSKAAGVNKVTGGSTVELNASGRLNLEGSTIHFAEGAATAEESGLGEAPEKGTKTTTQLEQLKPLPRNIEEDVAYETPEENTDPKAQEYHQERKTETTSDIGAPVENVEKPTNIVKPTKTDCDIIFGMTTFPDSYVLHIDATGYKWTVGQLKRGNTITPGKYGMGLGRGLRDMTTQEIVCNMKALAVNILGPINESIGPVGKAWTMTSCYRNSIPNGGSPTSQHLSGSAVDISPGGNFAYKLNYDWATKLAAILPYDQMILEYRDPGVNGNKNPQRINWIHISYNNYGEQKKDLRTFLNDKTHTANQLVLLA